MTAAPAPARLSAAEIKRRVKAVIDALGLQAEDVGAVIVTNTEVRVLTARAAANLNDPFEEWERGAA